MTYTTQQVNQLAYILRQFDPTSTYIYIEQGTDGKPAPDFLYTEFIFYSFDYDRIALYYQRGGTMHFPINNQNLLTYLQNNQQQIVTEIQNLLYQVGRNDLT